MKKTRFGMDIFGIASLGIGLFAGMLAVGKLGDKNVHVWSPLFVVPLLVAIVSVWMFFRHISHSARPFIAPRLIHGPSFGPVNLVNMIYGGITIGAVALVPLYATDRYGIGALDSGTLLVAQGAAAIILSVAGALALGRTGHPLPIYVGGVLTAAGMVLLALYPHGMSPYIWLAGSAFLVGAGGAMLNPASRNAGLQLAPEHSSTLAALRSLSLQIGAIATVSITTATLAGSLDSGGVQASVYIAAALLLLIALPLITRVPEHHGSW